MYNKKRLILIFGLPNAGKSYLSFKLEDEFFPIHLDQLYVDFIRTKYKHLDREDLGRVIMGHYDKDFGKVPEQVTAWSEHIIKVAKDSLKNNNKVSIEGYLLHPKASPQILVVIQNALKETAKITTVIVVSRTYFELTETDLKDLLSRWGCQQSRSQA